MFNEKSAKISVFSIMFLFIIISCLFIVPVFGRDIGILSHDSLVTLNPNVANCNQDLPNEFTLNIYNSQGYGIYDIKILKPATNIVDLTCGDAPVGWDKLPGYGNFCRYSTDPYGDYVIEDGEDLDFTFEATLDEEECFSIFKVSTLDNEGIITGTGEGEEKQQELTLRVDCSNPIITKTIGEPNIFEDFFHWITQNTFIDFLVTDNYDPDDNENCNLGLDYCEYEVYIDGVYSVEYSNIYNSEEGEDIDWTEQFNEDSEHEIRLVCYDKAGNIATLNETDKVDSTAPETEKKYGLPFYGSGEKHWITPNTPITLNPEDGGDVCAIGVDKTWYISMLVDDKYCESIQSCEEMCANPYDELCKNTQMTIDYFQDECENDLRGYSDWHNCVESEVQRCCDGETNNPNCGKTPEGYEIMYCDITCTTDPQECNSNIDGINDMWNLYQNPFNINEESCHLIQYFSIDELGNIEEMNHQCVYVDDKNPVVRADTGEPRIPCENDICDYWIRDHVTPITLSCYDQEPHPSGVDRIEYRWKLDNNNWGDWLVYNEPIVFTEDSVHYLEYKCFDNVGHVSNTLEKVFRVDSTAPIISKYVFGEYLGNCPPEPNNQEDKCYIKIGEENGVMINAYDPDPTGMGCNVDNLECYYEVWWNVSRDECSDRIWDEEKGCLVNSDEFDRIINVSFYEDSEHKLIINCSDSLGNSIEDIEIFYVDDKAPETKLEYIPDAYNYNGIDYIDTIHLVNLTAEDEKVGVDTTYYRVSGSLANKFCEQCENWMNMLRPNMGEWKTYDNPFGVGEESCHIIEYKSIDKLGNEEEINWNCVYVDKTSPNITKTYEGPYYSNDISEWINSQTNVVINAEDNNPHASGIKEIKYRYKRVEDSNCLEECSAEGTGDWNTYDEPFNIKEDSCHLIEIIAIDNVGKSSEHKQCVFVDNQAPEINKEIIGPKYELNEKTYIDGVTLINITANDPEPHPVNGITCEWSYILDDDETYGPFNEFPINFKEESKHNLIIQCKDRLGNTATDEEVFYVDKTKPETNVEYGLPFYSDKISKWINSQTLINLSAKDSIGEHNTGIKQTNYRVSLIDDEACRNIEMCQETNGQDNWNVYNNPFNINEESCHLIEYYSIDNVNKTEDVKKQCVFVDNQAPEPVKTLNEPFTEWYPVDVATNPLDEDATHFYPWIVDKCWNKQGDSIDCWKVTLDTPISMTCNDPEPHPVNNEKICFNIELDAEDKTIKYCDEYNGELEDGYCCLDETIDNFKFLEESEHNLKFYCKDALGNSNKENYDEEKFKVIGKMFKIRLNDKWNLISVPFELLNEKPEEVFKNADSVQTVWGYNAETNTWKVYRPGALTNNLNKIEPGYGYWVLSDCNESTNNNLIFNAEDLRNKCDSEKCEMLILGGSLYNPGATIPPNVKLAEGWNLIGYYGTEGRWWYNGPNSFYFKDSKEAYCELYSLRNLNGGLLNPTKWSGLITYWEPDNPNSWYDLGWCSEMNPGAGYWISMDAEGDYKPSTVCEEGALDEICGTPLINRIFK